jgi:hypothetical protein
VHNSAVFPFGHTHVPAPEISEPRPADRETPPLPPFSYRAAYELLAAFAREMLGHGTPPYTIKYVSLVYTANQVHSSEEPTTVWVFSSPLRNGATLSVVKQSAMTFSCGTLVYTTAIPSAVPSVMPSSPSSPHRSAIPARHIGPPCRAAQVFLAAIDTIGAGILWQNLVNRGLLPLRDDWTAFIAILFFIIEARAA